MAEKGPNPHARPQEVAAYVAVLSRELRSMVAPHHIPALAYLLELVSLEAEACAQDQGEERSRSHSSVASG